MLFNSVAFLIFLPIVFGVYWSLQSRSLTLQNLALLGASYLFYGWWDYRFLSLIVVSSIVDYWVGVRMQREEVQSKRKGLLWISVCVNLGILGVFKYFDFFIHSFADLLSAFGLSANLPTLRVILPVGISFYTFQTMSYTIDIYRRQIPATRDPIAFFAFVSFFPQLVAGPIERARNLLPQFEKRRTLDWNGARDGLRQMLWGLFKKVVIADNLAADVEKVFTNYPEMSGVTQILGTFFFAAQIYCDFSGYSDIAIGSARLFGFSLMRNFAFPYFSRDIAEFWRRWHISLSSWFRDYVYISMGGSRVPRSRRIFNILVTFTVSGLWHGANWTFVVWGLLNGLYYIPLMLTEKHRRYDEIAAKDRWLPGLREFSAVLVTFALTLFAWVFFRADSLSHALGFLGHLVANPLGDAESLITGLEPSWKGNLLLTAVLFTVEWIQRTKQHGLQIGNAPTSVRWAIYYLLIASIFWFGNFHYVPFIYFQF